MAFVEEAAVLVSLLSSLVVEMYRSLPSTPFRTISQLGEGGLSGDENRMFKATSFRCLEPEQAKAPPPFFIASSVSPFELKRNPTAALCPQRPVYYP